jgi:pyruvate formate lyase activating enzyme
VTVSGGEPLCQPQFTAALLPALKERDIHTALDTTGFVPYDRLEAALPYTDLFLYDLKHMDSAQHKAVIGVPNELILENAEKLAAAGAKLQIRIPSSRILTTRRTTSGRRPFLPRIGAAVEIIQLLSLPQYGAL